METIAIEAADKPARYRELLPMEHDASIVSLGETMTPLLPAPRLGAHFGVRDLRVKDESRLPTGSFKARGMALAVSMAQELGLTRLAVPTAGNAGGARPADPPPPRRGAPRVLAHAPPPHHRTTRPASTARSASSPARRPSSSTA